MTEPATKREVPAGYAYTPPVDDTSWRIARNLRVGLTLLLAFLGARAFQDEYGQVPLISDIGVAIHEFGHNLFMPFGIQFLGETMVILGGSLTQFAFPMIFVGYFLFSKKHRDLYAASVCVWWSAINLLDVAIYIGDSRAGVLPLLNGLTGQDEGSGHDWQTLLTQWGVLQRDTLYARQMRGVAFLMFAVSILAGLYYGWQRRFPKAEE